MPCFHDAGTKPNQIRTMQIQFQKRNAAQHTLRIFRGGTLMEQAVYDTKTYFLHDVVHYCVETQLGLKNGFWGLLAQSYKLADFGTGKVPMRELSRTEKIVGPVQSFYSGHMPADLLLENLKIIDFTPPEDFLTKVMARVKALMDTWRYLPAGEVLELHFEV